MYRIGSRIVLVTFVIISLWLLVAGAAVLICAAGRRAAARGRPRPRRVEQQRVRPRRAARRGSGPRLLLPLAVPVRLARARERVPRAPDPAAPGAAVGARSRASLGPRGEPARHP